MEMTFLSKEKLTKELNKHPMIAQHLDCMDVFDAINESVVDDVIQVVRCRDCKYWSSERINDFNKCRRWIKVGVKNFATMGDWFCADGERRTDDA